MISGSHHTAFLEMLARLGSALRHTHDYRQVCETIVGAVSSGTESENCSLYVLDGERQTLFLRAAMGSRDAAPMYVPDDCVGPNRQPFRLGEGIAGRVAVSRRPELIGNVTADEGFVGRPGMAVDVASLVCVPVIDGDELIGIINLSHSREQAFAVEQLTMLEVVADQAAKALRNARLIAELQRDNRFLAAEVTVGGRQLEASERRYRLLVERALDGIVVVDDDRLSYVNPCFLRMCDRETLEPGTRFSSLVTVDLRMSGKLPAGEGLEPAGSDSADAVVPEVRFRGLLRRAEGQQIPVEVAGCAVSDAPGSAWQYHVHDISGRVRFERLRDSFFAYLVHEIKNPITVINSYLQSLMADRRHFSKRRQKVIVEMEQAGKRLLTLLQDILAYSRLNSVPGDLKFSCRQMNDEINNAVDYFSPLITEKKVAVERRLHPDLPPFEFDREQLSRVIVNLMDNALKFCNPGGRIVWSSAVCAATELPTFIPALGRAAPAVPGAGAADDGRWVVVSIADDGTGLPAEHPEIVFDEFYTSRRGRGSGLGLSICRKIVVGHGGEIYAEPLTPGSRFTFVLPCRRCPQTVAGGSETA